MIVGKPVWEIGVGGGERDLDLVIVKSSFLMSVTAFTEVAPPDFVSPR